MRQNTVVTGTNPASAPLLAIGNPGTNPPVNLPHQVVHSEQHLRVMAQQSGASGQFHRVPNLGISNGFDRPNNHLAHRFGSVWGGNEGF